MQCEYFERVDPDPHVASLSAAGPETVPALPAVCEPMLQRGVAAEAVQRRAFQALSLKQNNGPQLLATRPRDRQVEDLQLLRPEESEGEDAVER